MAARDPNAAVVRFVEVLRRTVGCITQVPLTALPTQSDAYHIIFYPGPALLRTKTGTPNLKLSIVHHCRPIPRPEVADAFTISSAYYAYEILDLDEREILAYHWHPAGKSHVITPHLHLTSKIGPVEVASSSQSPGVLRLADMHISTGRVLLEDVVRLLINEFNVTPLKSDWEDILLENSEAHRADRAW